MVDAIDKEVATGEEHIAPKPVEVTSVPETPVNGATPAGGTPRPEMKIPVEPEDDSKPGIDVSGCAAKPAAVMEEAAANGEHVQVATTVAPDDELEAKASAMESSSSAQAPMGAASLDPVAKTSASSVEPVAETSVSEPEAAMPSTTEPAKTIPSTADPAASNSSPSPTPAGEKRKLTTDDAPSPKKTKTADHGTTNGNARKVGRPRKDSKKDAPLPPPPPPPPAASASASASASAAAPAVGRTARKTRSQGPAEV